MADETNDGALPSENDSSVPESLDSIIEGERNTCEFCHAREATKFHPTKKHTMSDGCTVSMWWCGICDAEIAQSKCFVCAGVATRLCPSCRRTYCETHASSIDERYCVACLNDKVPEIEKKPLVDAEGVTHTGSLLTVPESSPIKSFPAEVASMKDDELRSMLQRCRVEVRRYEQGLDHWRIKQGTVEMEAKHRDKQKLAALRKDKSGIAGILKTAGGGIAVTSTSTNGKTTKTPVSQEMLYKALAIKLQQMGMTKEQLQALVDQQTTNWSAARLKEKK